MRVGIPREVQINETRVALVPALVSKLRKDNHEVLVESQAGELAFIPDEQYVQAGATVIKTPTQLYEQADVIFKIQPPQYHPVVLRHEAEMIREGAVYIGFLSPFSSQHVVEIFERRRITALSMELIPRITRAQSMDALSSMATVAGYKAVLVAAERQAKMFPLLMTAAGTISPAVVLVLGAGVAGLQAIATAKRLGARVEAFDPRPAVKEQVKSLGANFVEMELPKDAETSGGYAKEQSMEFLIKEREAISSRFPKVDVVICTAQIFGKRAPLLITTDMLKNMRPGAVIVDLAAEQGGNCELTRAGETVEYDGITVIGAGNLPATVPADASLMYSHNVVNLFRHLYSGKDGILDETDEIFTSACVTRNGNIVNELVKANMLKGVKG